MRQLSENTYTLKSNLPRAALMDRLKANTLPKKKLVLEITDKKFIGRIEGNSFSVISSFFFSASACVLHGVINDQSEIVVTTTLNNAYRALFTIWLLLGTIAFIITAIMQLSSVVDFLILIVPFSFAVVFFRLFLHGIYLFSRGNALNKLVGLLEANDNNLASGSN